MTIVNDKSSSSKMNFYTKDLIILSFFCVSDIMEKTTFIRNFENVLAKNTIYWFPRFLLNHLKKNSEQKKNKKLHGTLCLWLI